MQFFKSTNKVKSGFLKSGCKRMLKETKWTNWGLLPTKHPLPLLRGQHHQEKKNAEEASKLVFFVKNGIQSVIVHFHLSVHLIFYSLFGNLQAADQMQLTSPLADLQVRKFKETFFVVVAINIFSIYLLFHVEYFKAQYRQ